MSSTKDAERLRRFFAERIAPTAERLRARGVEFFPLGPTPDESWYAPRHLGSDFRSLEATELETALLDQWRDVPELAELVPELLELANSLDAQSEGPEEVSPFVYVMY